MRHGQVDAAGAHPLGPCRRAAGQADARLWAARDLDLAPGERDAEPERLSDGLLPRKPGGEVLRRVRPREAVVALGLGEDALHEPWVANEGPRNPVDLDQ